MNVKLVLKYIKAASKWFILIGFFLTVNICLYLYTSLFQQRKIESLQNTWSRNRDAAAGRGVTDVAAIYRQGEIDLKDWRSRILPKKDFARFVAGLFETASHNSVTCKGISYTVSHVKAEDLIAYTLALDVTGKYGGIKSFIADIGREKEILSIDNISLSNVDATGDAVNLKLTVTVYLRPEGQ
jgi:type IV pilus assembly protein PilO